LIAAERTGRRGYGTEIDPLYCDIIVRRLHAVCGLEAILESGGKSFQQIQAERSEPS
jgi:DNA modification methylase